jgi:hypothetical protein
MVACDGASERGQLGHALAEVVARASEPVNQHEGPLAVARLLELHFDAAQFDLASRVSHAAARLASGFPVR